MNYGFIFYRKVILLLSLSLMALSILSTSGIDTLFFLAAFIYHFITVNSRMGTLQNYEYKAKPDWLNQLKLDYARLAQYNLRVGIVDELFQ